MLYEFECKECGSMYKVHYEYFYHSKLHNTLNLCNHCYFNKLASYNRKRVFNTTSPVNRKGGLVLKSHYKRRNRS